MGAHRDTRVDQGADARGDAHATLDLHHGGTGPPHHLRGGEDGLLVGGLVGAEGEVGDDEGVARTADDGGGDVDHLVEADLLCLVVPEDHVRGGVSDEQALHAAVGQGAGGGVVVGGEHGPLLAGGLLLAEIPDPDLAGGGEVTDGGCSCGVRHVTALCHYRRCSVNDL